MLDKQYVVGNAAEMIMIFAANPLKNDLIRFCCGFLITAGITEFAQIGFMLVAAGFFDVMIAACRLKRKAKNPLMLGVADMFVETKTGIARQND